MMRPLPVPLLLTLAHDFLVVVVVGIAVVVILAAVSMGLWLPRLMDWLDGGRETADVIPAELGGVGQPIMADGAARTASAQAPATGSPPATGPATGAPLLPHASLSFWR
jgi:hypothetical protein